ncbi:aldo/keto reductase [uncultured Alistipes sp.]|uniref:aldo/keto reductase n=2 Tax=uncultured Alistipes sp. TaxID=538949 RepID=UPI0026F03EAE|nr:aldo/keto reductase [uncultured Alistipes sp.]
MKKSLPTPAATTASPTDVRHRTDGPAEAGKRMSAPTGRHESEAFAPATGSDGTPPVVTLGNGYTMPTVGLGCYSLHGETCIWAILSAVGLGYRKFDTAAFYGNEKEVGEALRRSGIPRRKLFVATKLYPNRFADAENAIEESLRKLDIGYIDLMLLHHPGAHDTKAYRAMERAVEAGTIRSLGLSNYYIAETREFLPRTKIGPILVQNEIHPYYRDRAAREFLQRNGIVVEAWYPLGGRGYTDALLGDGTVSRIARRHGRSPAQIVLRWNLQNGVAVVPGSSDPIHQKENIALFDFSLTPEEMAAIDALDRNEKHDWY